MLGAFLRILHYEKLLSEIGTYFGRLRIVNEALGPHWVFRLADAVGLDTIKANRPSWHEFYVEDVDRLHCPLDPGAPETEAYLGRKYSDMDMAFYAGMGFDGYRLALETPRIVEPDTKRIRFDDRFTLEPSSELTVKLETYEHRRYIPKEDYYAAYGAALTALFTYIRSDAASDEILTRMAASCLILLCGGHKGCSKHITPEEEFRAQMESLIIFNQVRNLVVAGIELTPAPRIRAVS